MMSAVQNFIAEPIRHRRFDLAWYRLSQLLHERTNGAFDNAYMRFARLVRPKVELPASPQMPPAEVTGVVERLKRDGYMILPFRLSVEEVDAIANFAFTTPAHGANMHNNVNITRDNIPHNEPRWYWWMSDLVRVPAIQRMFAQGPYCAIAQEYLGCRPSLAHVTLFLDVPYEGKYEPYSYHYDNEGPGFLKFFFFLTNVTVGTGAHYFIAGSHTRNKPDPFVRATLYEAEPLLKSYGAEREVVMQGPAGTILAEDTAGFHRGSTIERDYRLMMQFEFSVIEVPTDQELARRLEPAPVPGLHPGIAAMCGKYLARMEQ
jgi:hypothetical protein